MTIPQTVCRLHQSFQCCSGLRCPLFPLVQPVVLERIPSDEASRPGGGCTWIHTKALYRLTRESKQIMKGCSDEMCSTSAMLTGVRVSDWIDED